MVTRNSSRVVLYRKNHCSIFNINQNLQLNQLVASYHCVDKQRGKLERAIADLKSVSTVYCHLDHFSAEEYYVYNTDCHIDIGRQRIRVLCREVDDLRSTLKRFHRKLSCQSFNEIQDTDNRTIQRSLREEELK